MKGGATKLMCSPNNGLSLLSLLALVSVGISGAPLTAASASSETAVFAGGCFWGVEAVFEHVKGVQDVVSGYAGGDRGGFGASSAEPGKSFAEAVRVSFDPAQISYQQLLAIFMNVAHDPTQVDRQGPDVGPRYRSAIFPRDKGQRDAAENYIKQLRASNRFGRPISTRIETGGFTVAEPSQQDFVRKHPTALYVVQVDIPKLKHLEAQYPQLWRS